MVYFSRHAEQAQTKMMMIKLQQIDHQKVYSDVNIIITQILVLFHTIKTYFRTRGQFVVFFLFNHPM